MNQYVKGETIKAFREKNKMTQAVLAEKIGVTDKAVSKWETGRDRTHRRCPGAFGGGTLRG